MSFSNIIWQGYLCVSREKDILYLFISQVVLICKTSTFEVNFLHHIAIDHQNTYVYLTCIKS